MGFVKLKKNQLVIDHSVRDLCYKPYPGRKNGCPNYKKKNHCPPRVKYIEDTFVLNKGVWLVWNKFNIGKHAKRMWKKHPNWSEKQAHCLLYWQNTARVELKIIVRNLFTEEFFKTLTVGEVTRMATLYCPEARGVNITETMKRGAGVELEWPPRKFAYQVALIGTLKLRRIG